QQPQVDRFGSYIFKSLVEMNLPNNLPRQYSLGEKNLIIHRGKYWRNQYTISTDEQVEFTIFYDGNVILHTPQGEKIDMKTLISKDRELATNYLHFLENIYNSLAEIRKQEEVLKTKNIEEQREGINAAFKAFLK